MFHNIDSIIRSIEFTTVIVIMLVVCITRIISSNDRISYDCTAATIDGRHIKASLYQRLRVFLIIKYENKKPTNISTASSIKSLLSRLNLPVTKYCQVVTRVLPITIPMIKYMIALRSFFPTESPPPRLAVSLLMRHK